MRRGDVCWVDFEPARGGEIRKVRPAVIVSSDIVNAKLNRLQVIPLTSNVSRVYLGEAIVRVNGRTAKAMADQIRTVAKERFGGFMGRVEAQDMFDIEQAIMEQLGLD